MFILRRLFILYNARNAKNAKRPPFRLRGGYAGRPVNITRAVVVLRGRFALSKGKRLPRKNISPSTLVFHFWRIWLSFEDFFNYEVRSL